MKWMPNRSLAPLVWILAGVFACAGGDASRRLDLDTEAVAADTYIVPLAPGVWRHVSSLEVPGFGKVSSNGVLVASKDAAVVIDTAWNDQQTAGILDWADQRGLLVRAVIVTHAHTDRLGGLAEVKRRGIPVYSLGETARLAAEEKRPAIDYPVTSGFDLGPLGIAGEIFFPGAGHVDDNAVVWLDAPRVLVGGCLVREIDAETLGDTRYANLAEWPASIRALQERYPAAKTIVPGHGAPGGQELLEHTAELLAIRGSGSVRPEAVDDGSLRGPQVK